MASKVIVVVEDQPPVARLLRELLNNVPGYGAVTVANAALTLDVVAAVLPDLIVTDVDLPGPGGFDLLDLIRRHAEPRVAATPVLVMSAGEHRAEATRRGVPYIAKPFDPDDFLAEVRRLLRAS